MKRLRIKEIHQGFKSRAFSPVELTKEYITQAKHLNKINNALLIILEERAIKEAEWLEMRLKSGEDLRLLDGIPITFKDLIDTKGIRTTYGAEIDRFHIPERDAVVVEKLKSVGAIHLGKTNLHEYAFGITSNNPHFGPVRNPWNPNYTPGGSSGGSGAAVAANMSVASIGTDTGGSIRIPSASCGLVGLKPTYGLVDSTGVLNISWTLDHVGPITANVEDCAVMMEAMTGLNYQNYLNKDCKGMRIGVPSTFFTEQIEPEVKQHYHKALKQLEDLGAILVEVDMSMASNALPHTFTIAGCEAVYIHKSRMEADIEKYGADVRAVLEGSRQIPSLDYISSLKTRSELSKQVDAIFENIDVLATPTLPAMTKQIGVEEVTFPDITEPIFHCMIRYTSLFNITGHPALNLPVGYSSERLPIGIQLVTGKNLEKNLFKLGSAYERDFLQTFYEERDEICMRGTKH
ncbi:amidase [Ammoniphilus sp. CFH 90114]|uniref:amidase n=1 Tax=Ammoniphilus sp. CFH 90114 TaxID=2493665 RepID=UPI00100E2C0B|nr:amidase [Ammoniphilus sp. CFH 90114]RXT06947.1 amidase [Ammoniphilus sp. CFH 90114]